MLGVNSKKALRVSADSTWGILLTYLICIATVLLQNLLPCERVISGVDSAPPTHDEYPFPEPTASPPPAFALSSPPTPSPLSSEYPPEPPLTKLLLLSEILCHSKSHCPSYIIHNKKSFTMHVDQLVYLQLRRKRRQLRLTTAALTWSWERKIVINILLFTRKTIW